MLFIHLGQSQNQCRLNDPTKCNFFQWIQGSVNFFKNGCKSDLNCSPNTKCVILKIAFFLLAWHTLNIHYTKKCADDCKYLTCQTVTINSTKATTLSNTSTTNSQSVKPGRCPPPPDFGPCVELCSNDSACKGAKKCVCNLNESISFEFHITVFFSLQCSIGCGHDCKDPIWELNLRSFFRWAFFLFNLSTIRM